MDPISLIMAALIAGAGVGAGDLASDVIKDSYSSLKALLKRHLVKVSTSSAEDAGGRAGEGRQQAMAPDAVLEALKDDPNKWAAAVRDLLVDARVDEDPDVLAVARDILNRCDDPTYRVDARGAQGVQLGDHNQMTNTFGVSPPTSSI